MSQDDEKGDRPHAEEIRNLRVGLVERGVAFRFSEAVPAALKEIDRLRALLAEKEK